MEKKKKRNCKAHWGLEGSGAEHRQLHVAEERILRTVKIHMAVTQLGLSETFEHSLYGTDERKRQPRNVQMF